MRWQAKTTRVVANLDDTEDNSACVHNIQQQLAANQVPDPRDRALLSSSRTTRNAWNTLLECHASA